MILCLFLILNNFIMARFQYGSFITRISGSIGGTTFRQFRGMPVVYNKTSGTSKSRLLSNNRLSGLAYIFRYWATLTPSEKSDWQSVSNGYTFPDKFGVPRILTGKDFFTKCNTQLLPVNAFNGTATAFDGAIRYRILNQFKVHKSSADALIDMLTGGGFNYFIFQFEVFNGKVPAPVFNRRKILYSTLNDSNFTADPYGEILKAFPYLQIGWTVRMYYTNMSLYGLRNPWEYIDTVVD